MTTRWGQRNYSAMLVRLGILALVFGPTASPTAAQPACVPPNAPLAEPDPPGDAALVCLGGDNAGALCEVLEDCPSGSCGTATRTNNRYLTILAPANWAGKQLALRVSLISIDSFASFDGETRWVGAPQSFPEEGWSDPDRTFLGAPVACSPVYRDWATTELLQVFGSEILPQSVYMVQAVEQGCDEADEASYSEPLVLLSARWGDLAPLFAPGWGMDKSDIVALFQKYDGDPDAPVKARAQLQPNTPEPIYPISMRDIALDVAAFVGSPYAALFVGPEICPHRVPRCGDGVLDSGEDCDDGNIVPNDGCSAICLGENPTAVIRIVAIDPPVGTGVTYPPDVVINGNDFFLGSGGVRLWFQIQISGWGGALGTFQATVVQPFANGIGADLEKPLELCDSHEDCVAVMGTGSTCQSTLTQRVCEFAFQDSYDLRFPFHSAFISGVAAHNLAFGATTIPFGPDGVDDGGVFHGGILVLDVPEDAAGSYTIGFNPDRRATFLLDDSSPLRLPISIAPLEAVVVRLGEACCLGLTCANMFPKDCLGSGGVPVGVCGGDCNGTGRADACEIVGGMSSDCNGNDLPDECEADCNANGVADDCDLATGTSFDCNGNAAPDACDIAQEVSADCNANAVPDECDIASQASDDCNFDLVPDECQPDEDCNANSIRDICDLGAGTSDDCNFDLVPDDCQPDEDCNANSIRDLCELGAGTEQDCNGNLALDECDIASGGSFDDNVDGVPDECCRPPTPVFVLEKKSRYLSLASIGTIGVRQALRVTFLENASYPELNFQSLWVGAPREYPEEDSSQPGLTFTGAGLSCTPHYQDWSAIEVLHVFGAEIVPRSTYAVQLINEGCPEDFPTNYSGALPASTGKWGDQAPLFDGPGNPPSPDFNDIAGSVQKFKGSPGAPIKALAQLQPNSPIPERSISFRDIAATTSAFIGTPYIGTVPDAGPCACPSTVTCVVTACVNDLECGPGFCIAGFCTDACGRCRP